MQHLRILQRVPTHLLVPLLFVLFKVVTEPLGQTFEFDADEGINLMKALLYADGFSLYKDIWSDQPPVFTVLLSSWFNLFGASIVAARSLVLLFAALLLWSFYNTLRLTLGVWPAIAGVLILINTHAFMRLSGSVMIGLPALALAMLSIYLLLLSQLRQSRFGIVASGCVLALSLQTKLFSIFLIPILLIVLLDIQFKPQTIRARIRSTLPNAILWLVAVGVTYVTVGLLAHSIDPEQLLLAHFSDRREQVFTEFFVSFPRLLKHTFGLDYLYYILAVIGIIVILKEKCRQGLLPLAWLGSVCLLLFNHRPVWYHHYLLISIPLAWLCAISIAWAMRSSSPYGVIEVWQRQIISRKHLTTNAGIAALIALLVTSAIAIESYQSLERSVNQSVGEQTKAAVQSEQVKVVNLLLQHPNQTRWIFTDRPIYAFYAGLRVPPEIAVLSIKRVLTAQISQDTLLDVLKHYQPDQLLLSRFRVEASAHAAMNRYINQHYAKVYTSELAKVDYYLKQSQ